MFRRRGFVRPLGRNPILDIPPALLRANELMSIGNFPAAALAFEELAQAAVAHNGPRAPMLLLQAGRMRILAGQVPAGMIHLQQGLALLAARNQWKQLQNSANRVMEELKENGLGDQAGQIEQILETKLALASVPGMSSGPVKPKPILPTNCPGCGAPLRSDEVEWLDEATAGCPFCGSSVRAV